MECIGAAKILHRFNSDKLELQEAHLVAKEKLPSSAGQNIVCVTDCADVPENSPNVRSSAVLLRTVDLPAIMVRFRHLSSKVKSLFRSMSQTSVEDYVAIMKLALKGTKLPFHANVREVREGYQCTLHIISVFVACGEDAKKKHATGKAYMHAAKLLQKAYFRLAMGCDISTVLIGSDKPFEELQSASKPEIDISPQTVIEPIIHDLVAENSDDRIRNPVASCTINSIASETDRSGEVAFVNASANDVSAQIEKRQNDGNSQIRSINIESSNTMSSSTVLDETHLNITSNHTDVLRQSTDASVGEQEVMDCPKTVVTARSHKDLSHLIDQFNSLAHIAKDIYAMFKSTKSVKDMFEMALHMSHMSLKSEVVKLGRGRFCCQLLIADVLFATAESYDKKSAKVMAYSMASELLHMPYLCLEEKLNAVQVIGSSKPFTDKIMPLDHGDFKVDPCLSQGFWPDNSRTTDNAEDKAVHEPLTALPYEFDLSKLVNYFHSLACRIKAISESALKVSSDMDLIQKALGGNFVHLKTHFIWEKGFGYLCELNINGVEVACGKASNKKEAKHAASNAVVVLMKKPYLRLQQDADQSQSYKLIGSDQPFVEVTSGVLPDDQNCVVTDKGKLVDKEQSAKPHVSLDSHQLQLSDVTRDIGKLKIEACFTDSLNSSEDASAMPEDLCKTQVSADACGMHVLELLNQFHALAHRVKSISKSSVEAHNSTNIIDTALADTQMQKKRLIAWLSSIVFRCELSVDGVVLSYGEGDTKEQAKDAAYNAAFELLSKPHLQLQQNLEFNRSFRLAGSDEPLDVVSHVRPTETRKIAAKDQRHRREKHPPDCLKMSKKSASRASENAFCAQQHVDTLLDQGLDNFVILQGHFRKMHKATMNILQQSASFNEWPLSYDLTKVEDGCRCLLTMGGYTLANTVGKGRKSAKKAAAEQALKRLSSVCYTLKVKKYDIVATALTRNEVWNG